MSCLSCLDGIWFWFARGFGAAAYAPQHERRRADGCERHENRVPVGVAEGLGAGFGRLDKQSLKQPRRARLAVVDRGLLRVGQARQVLRPRVGGAVGRTGQRAFDVPVYADLASPVGLGCAGNF